MCHFCVDCKYVAVWGIWSGSQEEFRCTRYMQQVRDTISGRVIPHNVKRCIDVRQGAECEYFEKAGFFRRMKRKFVR